MRQIAFLARATAQHPDAVAAADAAPDDIEAAFAAADVEILQQNVAAAFDRLIALVRRTAGDERTSVRTRLIELFELFDPADPEVIAGSAQARQRAVLSLRSRPASNHRAASGGSTITAEAGRPCHGSSVASTAP